MPRVLNFSKALDSRIEEKRSKITELEAEIAQLERARAVFEESPRRGRRRGRKSA
jgi:hypothetical protein